MPSTIRLHRVIATKPEKVYRAFIEPDAIASWLPLRVLVHSTRNNCQGRR